MPEPFESRLHTPFVSLGAADESTKALRADFHRQALKAYTLRLIQNIYLVNRKMTFLSQFPLVGVAEMLPIAKSPFLKLGRQCQKAPEPLVLLPLFLA
jgi:hypothetical protein